MHVIVIFLSAPVLTLASCGAQRHTTLIRQNYETTEVAQNNHKEIGFEASNEQNLTHDTTITASDDAQVPAYVFADTEADETELS